jgi:hypothetical protein
MAGHSGRPSPTERGAFYRVKVQFGVEANNPKRRSLLIDIYLSVKNASGTLSGLAKVRMFGGLQYSRMVNLDNEHGVGQTELFS